MRLGRRIAFRIIQAIGRSATSLGYSICLAELIISPAMPSATTRGGGGVFYPIVQSLSSAFDSEPDPTAGRIGKYLMQVGFHADAVTCIMSLTSMAGNPLCVGLHRRRAHLNAVGGRRHRTGPRLPAPRAARPPQDCAARNQADSECTSDRA